MGLAFSRPLAPRCAVCLASVCRQARADRLVRRGSYLWHWRYHRNLSVLDGVLLRPLPYTDSDRLYLITENVQFKGKVFPNLPANSGNFELWRQYSKELSSLALLDPQSDNLYQKDGSVVRINGMRTTASLFPMLGVKPLLGHFFTSAQDRTGTGLFRSFSRTRSGNNSSAEILTLSVKRSA